MQIQGSTVVITGASQGLGAALALALARRGARVALLARTQHLLDQLVAQIVAAGGQARAYALDLSVAEQVASVGQQILAELGPPELLINNAGIGRWLFLHETSPQQALAMMQVPYFAALYTTQAFLPAMQQRRRGMLVFVNSPAAILPWPGATAYSASRWALRGFAEALRADLYRSGVKVMTVIPARIATTYFANNPGVEERIPPLARLIPNSSAEQVAQVILRGIEREQELVLTPRLLALFYQAYRVLPGLLRWLTIGLGRGR